MPGENEMFLVDTALMEEFLKEEEPNVRVKSITCKLATEKGDHYASKMFRANVKLENHQKIRSVLIKCLDDGELGRFFTENGMFEREIEMYRDTLPLIAKLVDGQVAPRTRYCRVGHEEFLLMEDLAPQGFKTANRMLGLDMSHARLVIEKLGQFHAASAIIAQRDPQAIQKYQKHLFYTPEMENFFMIMLRALALEVEFWPEHRHMKTKLEKISDRFTELGSRAVLNATEEDFFVLNHGDLWVSNLLFKYHENDEVSDIMFVDYQLVAYTSPVLDLHYFFNTSLQDIVWEKKDQLMAYYHECLVNNLIRMGYKKLPPTLEYLEKEFQKRAVLGLFSASIAFAVARSHPSDGFSLDNKVFKNDNYVVKREKIYSREATKLQIQKRLLDFEAQGVL